MVLSLFYTVSFGAIIDVVEPRSKAGYVASTPSYQGRISWEEQTTNIDISWSPKQWHLSRVRASQAWQITSGSPDVIIAILDTGIDQNHKALANKVTTNINFTHSPTVDDVNGHGTHVAGIIGATIDDTTSVTGLAYNSSLMNVKVAEDDGRCNSATVAKGIIWAVDNGAQVINISLTFTEPSLDLKNAVDYAWYKGVIVIAAAGNNLGTTKVYPAAYPNVIAVAATDTYDRLAAWSNQGDWVSLGAPGVNIYSLLPDGEYGYANGTSMSAAIVSGEAALLFTTVTDTNDNDRINDEVYHRIENNWDVLQVDEQVDEHVKGRVNILKALEAK